MFCSHPSPFPASVLQKRKSNPRAYREARRLMEEFQEVFENLPAILGEKRPEPSDKVEVGKDLAEAMSKQGGPKQGGPKHRSPKQRPGKRVAKKVPKV